MDTMIQKPPRSRRWALTWRMILMIVATVVVIMIVLIWPYRHYIAPFIFAPPSKKKKSRLSFPPLSCTANPGRRIWKWLER